MTSRYVFYDTYSKNPVYYSKFRHIQPYLVAFLELCVTLAYSEPALEKREMYPEHCQGIFWNIQNAVQRSHIENPAIVRTLSYPEFWH